MRHAGWLPLSLALTLAGCGTFTANQAQLGFVRAFLVDGGPEDPHFGRYSYLLFAKPPAGDHQREQYLAAIDAWMVQMQPIDERLTDSEKARYNITYLPVTDEPGGGSAEEVLDLYDYFSAGQLLRALPESSTSGLFLISVERPLMERSKAGQRVTKYYYSDLSHVQPSVVAHWVDLFMRETANADSWEHEEGVVEFMRNGIAALAKDLPNVKTAVLGWIKFGSD